MTEIHDNVQLEHVDQLIPYPNNPKKHPDEQISKIASSIQEYGFIQPIVVDSDNTVIIGHGRLKAARKLEMEEVPVIKRGDISESEAKALRLADNRISESGWDDESLAVELEQLEDEGFDTELTGFDEDEVSEALDSLTDGEDLEEPESEDPEQVETDIQEGEVFKLGEHRLMCGDATNEEHVEVLMNGEKADMVFTDPPFNITGSSTGLGGNIRDTALMEPFFSSANDMISNYTKKMGHVYVCCDWRTYPMLFEKLDKLEPKNLIVWDKLNGGMGANYMNQYELVFFLHNYRESDSSSKERDEQDAVKTIPGDTNMWEIGRDTVSFEGNERTHFAQKPPELMSRGIENSSKQNDIVLDLFAGSGTTLLAAEQINRKAFCMELDPQYVQVIINRWKELTGEEPEKLQ